MNSVSSFPLIKLLTMLVLGSIHSACASGLVGEMSDVPLTESALSLALQTK